MKPAHPQAGFTLAELLAGLAIAAIIMLPLADMLRTATGHAIVEREALDLDKDASFALDRIAARVRAATAAPAGAMASTASWFAPLVYRQENSELVEVDSTANPVRRSVIARNVAAFALTAPEVVAGWYLVDIELTLKFGETIVTRKRTVRVGGGP